MTIKFAALTSCFVALLMFTISSEAAATETQRFLFIGDLPYSTEQRDRLSDVIIPAIRVDDFPFLVHYGDLKSGSVPCTETLITESYTQLMGIWSKTAETNQLPTVFYTPGDNEWTDCDRRFIGDETGGPMSELKALDVLRRIFFSEPIQVPSTWNYERQSLYPENAIWRYGRIEFATVHMVGTNNGRLEILMDDVGVALAHVDARDEANRAWLNRIFARASHFRNPADAVIITTQADVTDPDEFAPCTPSNQMNCDAYSGFRVQLAKHAASFKRPVLLVHGDTGPYCIDRELGTDKAPNLWRLNAGGDYHRPLDATVVTFHAGEPEAPFSAQGLVDGEALAGQC